MRSTNKFEPLTGGYQFSPNDERYPLNFTREQMLRLQYSKLINYFGDQLAREWGGPFFATGNFAEVLNGWEQFAAFTAATTPTLPLWIKRKDDNHPWEPANTVLTREPDPALGQRFEAYMSINGTILRVRDAARFMLVDIKTLLDLKLKLLVDNAVMAALILTVLEPGFKENRVIVSR